MALSTIGTNGISDSAVTAAKTSGVGITMVDQWRLSDHLTGNQNPITSNLERIDTRGFSSALGSGMSESSGVFTFPSTGFYQVMAGFKFDENGSGDDNEINGAIEYTSDNGSNWYVSVYVTGMTFSSNSTTLQTGAFIYDITDTSNQKIRFSVSNMLSSNRTIGNTNAAETFFTFVRLGDT